MFGFCRFFLYLGLGLFVILPLVLSQAHAESCDALRTRLSDGKRSNPQVVQLNKQLATIRAFQRQRECNAKNTGGLFSACGDLARRRAAVEQKIQTAARSSLGANSDDIRARMASLGCKPNVTKTRKRESAQQGGTRGNAMLFCVRQSDGYLFPAPNSQFVGAEDYEQTLSRCQYICDDRQMDVYILDDSALETDEMLSVKTGQAYKNLSSAFDYRAAGDFRGCDWQRYNRKVHEARARTITPKTADADDVVLPIPQARPDIDGSTAYADDVSVLNPGAGRKVRVIGEPYLPN